MFAVAWWVIAVAIGAWLGRRAETTKAIGRLLAGARTSNTLPEIRPGLVLLNRLWLLAVSAVLAAGLSWLFPQFSAVVAGGAFLVALAWRKQEPAVTAIEERDGIRYYVVPSSPFGAIELTRTPGLRRVTSSTAHCRSGWRCARAFCSLSSCGHVRVFATCSFVSHARRAVATP